MLTSNTSSTFNSKSMLKLAFSWCKRPLIIQQQPNKRSHSIVITSNSRFSLEINFGSMKYKDKTFLNDYIQSGRGKWKSSKPASHSLHRPVTFQYPLVLNLLNSWLMDSSDSPWPPAAFSGSSWESRLKEHLCRDDCGWRLDELRGLNIWIY